MLMWVVIQSVLLIKTACKLGACRPGMSKSELLVRYDAWLSEAISRARSDQKCWGGRLLWTVFEVSLIEKTKLAFSWRLMPERTVRQGHPPTDIYDDAQYFCGRRWESILPYELEHYYSAFSGFTNEAFRYYLPAVVNARVANIQPNLILFNGLPRRTLSLRLQR